MALTISPILSVLVSALMETLFYGVNVAFFCLAMFLLRNKILTTARSPLVYVLVLLFFSLTGHVGVQWKRLVDAFYFAKTKQESVEYFLNLSEKTNVIKQYFGVFITLFQDILIVWRLYTVWMNNLFICILPVCMVFVTFGTGLAMADMQSHALATDSIFVTKISQFGLPYFIITLSTNLLATMLIAGRVWFSTRNLTALGKHNRRLLWRVVIIIVDSAAVTAFMQIIHLAFYAQKSPVAYFLDDSTFQIMGLVPTATVITVKLWGNDRDAMYSTGSYSNTGIWFRNTRTLNMNGGHISTDGSLGMEEQSIGLHNGLHDLGKQPSTSSIPGSSSVTV